jgi:hypothetical protein
MDGVGSAARRTMAGAVRDRDGVKEEDTDLIYHRVVLAPRPSGDDTAHENIDPSGPTKDLSFATRRRRDA